MRAAKERVGRALGLGLLVALGAGGGCGGGGEDAGALCDRRCPAGQKCAFVQGTLSTACVSDGSVPATGACDPPCLATQRCDSGECLTRSLTCTEVFDCVGSCPNPDACTAACIARGTAEAKTRFAALDTCAAAADCPDNACLIAACGAQLDACFGVATCSPACQAGSSCVSGVCQGADPSCGAVTADGQCQGAVLTWCERGSLKRQNCSLVGPGCACARRLPEDYYDCICDPQGGLCNPACLPGYTCTAQGCVPGGGGGSRCVPACPPGFICTPQGCESSGF